VYCCGKFWGDDFGRNLGKELGCLGKVRGKEPGRVYKGSGEGYEPNELVELFNMLFDELC
jgi:hypothetical protein